MILTLARWLARKAITAEFKREGRAISYIDARKITEASNIYLGLHRDELIREAWAYAKPLREQKRMRLARKAVIAEIRDRGGKVNSIAREELKRLIEEYLKDHPEERPFGEFVCY